MSLASVRDIAAIHEIADPWLIISTYKQPIDCGGMYYEGPYSFEAEVKADRDTPLEAEYGSPAAAHAIRVHLISRAEDAVAALDAAGWHLTGGPRMEITSKFAQTSADLSSPHLAGFMLKLSFEVGRLPTRQEHAMHPETMADDIMDKWERDGGLERLRQSAGG